MVEIIVCAVFGLGWVLQLAFYLLIFGRFAWGKNEKYQHRLAKQDWPPVSVVVAARNELENLQRLLPILLAQDYAEFEVIVVNDRSWDESWPFLYQLAQGQPRLRAVHVSQTPADFSGKKYALTLGIKAAKHPTILLTDADCAPQSPHWIAQMASHMSLGREIVLGFSPYETHPGLLNRFIQFETLLTAVQCFSWAVWGRAYMGLGRNLAYRRELFFRHKGFHRHIKLVGGDDDLFVNQAAHNSNVAICMGAESIVTSLPKTNIGDWFRQKKRHLSVGKFYKLSDKIVLGLFSASQLFTWMGGFGLIMLSLLTGRREWMALAAVGFMGKWLAQAMVLTGCQRKLGDRTSLILLPFLDLFYTIYYLVVGWAAFQSKQLRWK